VTGTRTYKKGYTTGKETPLSIRRLLARALEKKKGDVKRTKNNGWKSKGIWRGKKARKRAVRGGILLILLEGAQKRGEKGSVVNSGGGGLEATLRSTQKMGGEQGGHSKGQEKKSTFSVSDGKESDERSKKQNRKMTVGKRGWGVQPGMGKENGKLRVAGRPTRFFGRIKLSELKRGKTSNPCGNHNKILHPVVLVTDMNAANYRRTKEEGGRKSEKNHGTGKEKCKKRAGKD